MQKLNIRCKIMNLVFTFESNFFPLNDDIKALNIRKRKFMNILVFIRSQRYNKSRYRSHILKKNYCLP